MTRDNDTSSLSDTADRFRAPSANLDAADKQVANAFFGISGRLNRRDYAKQLLLYTLALCLCPFLLAIGYAFLSWKNLGEMAMALGILGGSLWISFYVLRQHVILLVQRLHDINRSGVQALLVLVPVLGQIFHLYIALRSGDTAKNRYGVVPANSNENDLMDTLFTLAGVIIVVCLTAPLLMVWLYIFI